ncbi:MAG: VPLPA-CTERM-specific exosortase XrtD [Pseudomonadota bacterium]
MTFQVPHVMSRAHGAPGAVMLAVMVLGAVPIFWLGLTSLAAAWVTAEYSHGPLIPLISLFLFIRGLRDAPRVSVPANRWPGVWVVALALCLAGLGNMAGIADVVSYALILWVAGVVLMCMGWDAGRRHQLAVFHLIFMLPLPQFLYWKVTVFLQALSSDLGVALIRLADIPVFLDGNVIDLGPYKLLVAEACSGLRYLFPILSFSYLIAIVYRGPAWHKLVLFGMAAPLCVGVNAARIGMIGLLVDAQGIAAAEGFLHLFEGWVIFAACLAVLAGTAVLLHRSLAGPMLDLDTSGLGGTVARVKAVTPSVALKVAAVLGILASTITLMDLRAPQAPPPRAGFAIFPTELGPWSGVQFDLDPAIARVLGASDYINSTYRESGSGAEVQFFAAWYASQTDGQGIHSPEVCLPGAGWEIAAHGLHDVDLPQTTYGPFTVNRAIIQRGLDQQLVYYWFEQRGRRMTNDFAAKLSVLKDGVVTGQTDGALVRVLTPLQAGEAPSEADARLQAFMAHALVQLPHYIP